MHIVVTQTNESSIVEKREDLLRFAFCDPVIAPVALHGLQQGFQLDLTTGPVILLPNDWRHESLDLYSNVAYHNGSFGYRDTAAKKSTFDQWVVISNGHYVSSFNCQAVRDLLVGMNDDVVSLYIDPLLSANSEKIVFSSNGDVAGFCRFYSDSILPAVEPGNWPHHLFIRRDVFENIFSDGMMPLDFKVFGELFKAAHLKTQSFKIGGTVLNLLHPSDWLDFISTSLNTMHSQDKRVYGGRNGKRDIPASAQIYGPVLIGDSVEIQDNAVLVGPTILCDNVRIGNGGVVRSSVVGPRLSIEKGRLVQNRILIKTAEPQRARTSNFNGHLESRFSTNLKKSYGTDNFREWPLFSYPRLGKRLADIVMSSCLLVLLAPLFPVIAVAIKLSSRGPVFFGHKRQGLHAKEFFCLKFRTMIPNADNIQDKLRIKNQVDGPQFKIDDDPRVTSIGRFLRDTYIDEIPQFINVLKGQMSMIGPRPSPQKENSLCPIWHDARLSVRPGITGLWQIKRTRKQGQDFQEWIHYDIEYIRHISPGMDLYICWETIKKIVSNFFHHF